MTHVVEDWHVIGLGLSRGLAGFVLKPAFGLTTPVGARAVPSCEKQFHHDLENRLPAVGFYYVGLFLYVCRIELG